MVRAAKAKAKGRERRYHHGDLRAALVAEARRVVEREGPEHVSLRGVAKAAGVSAAAPYHHFQDKHALLAAVAADGFRRFTETMLSHAEGASGPGERLHRLGVGYVTFAVRHPQLFRLMQGPTFQLDTVPEDLAAAREASYRPLVEAVTACLPQADEKTVREACAAAWSIVHGMATLCNDGRLNAVMDVSDLEGAAAAVTRHLDITAALEKTGRKSR